MIGTSQIGPGSDLLKAHGSNPPLLRLFAANAGFAKDHPEHHKTLPRVAVGLLGDFTLNSLLEPLVYFGRCMGLELIPEVLTPYQIESFLASGTLDATTASHRVLLLATDIEKLLGLQITNPDPTTVSNFEATLGRRLELCRVWSREQGVPVLVANFFTARPPLSQAYAHQGDFSQRRFVAKANNDLMDRCAEMGLHTVPFDRVLETYGASHCLSFQGYLSTDNPFTPEGANRIADQIARQVSSLFIKRRKLLVLDLDNTLWKGVLGEDGPNGIQYRPDSFEGRIFWHALHHFRTLAQTGVILAINSKNDERDVLSLLDSAEFPLKREDFAAIKANWQPKSENLRAISEELGLGLDSMVMLDDSDAECIQIRQALPEVEVVQVPKRLADYPLLLSFLPFFDRPVVTEADRLRKADYQSIQKRNRLAEAVADPEEFISSLGILITLQKADAGQLARVAQLFERTNQFNLSGVRFKQPELENLRDSNHLILCATYEDAFGSSGLVGALVGELRGDLLHLKNFVLSCRVLGRGVENAILASLREQVFGGSLESILIDYNDLPRNAPAREFLKKLDWKSEVPLVAASLFSHPKIRVVAK